MRYDGGSSVQQPGATDMPKGEQRSGREKKKPKKDKAAKHVSSYAAEYGRNPQPTHITDTPPGKKH
jgi:hypothetical protein